MRKKLTTLVAVTAFGVASFGLYSAGAFAAGPNQQSSAKQAKHPAHKTIMRCNKKRNMWRLGLKRNKNLTAADAQTLVKAALLMQNRKDLSIGQIQTMTSAKGRTFYKVQIINSGKHVVSQVIVSKNSGRIRPLPMPKPKT